VASETSIANAALRLVGERRINSLDDQTKAARLIRDSYEEKRDELLRTHSWNFAGARAELAEDSEAPVWGFDHSYTLPSDLLRLTGVNDEEKIGYRVEGGKIVTDIDAPLRIEYVRNVTDVEEMDVLFRQTLALEIAIDIVEPLTGQNDKVRDLQAQLSQKRRLAKGTDGQEPSPRHLDISEFLDAREDGNQ
jgi:hypothetical protein